MTVTIPSRFDRLDDLAHNLWWSWCPDASAAFARLGGVAWDACERNPVRLLASLDRAAVERDGSLDPLLERFEAYVRAPVRDLGATRIAYFSAEYAIDTSLPIYSGGLGVLAGDHLKSASDLALPLCAVGLFYAEGYNRQRIDAEGWQRERYPRNDPATLPLRLARRPDGRAIEVGIELPDRALRARVWRADVGRVRLYLLDADVPTNRGDDRRITARLYGGEGDTRVLQELLLGIGGLRALDAAGERPTVFHMNEGHSAFLALERARRFAHEHGVPWTRAVEACRAQNVFTTHTPVPAGNDSFAAERVEWYLRPFREALALPAEALLALGRPPDEPTRFSMPVLALRASARANGVSELHARVARTMWRSLWPNATSDDDVPIGAVTNGVHAPTWTDCAVGQRLAGTDGAIAWSRALALDDADLWKLHNGFRARLAGEIARRAPTATGFRADALTIVFARRFATYKRAALIAREPARLRALLASTTHPVQLVIAGKAHPKDEPGKQVLKQLVELAHEAEFAQRIFVLEDYDMTLARVLVAGADIWLNTPRRPLEASGTSGMKAAMNGGLNVSVLDGWWCEGYTADVGWAIEPDHDAAPGVERDEAEDARDADRLYTLLEREAVPRFYERDARGVPRAWCAMMKRAIAELGARFNTDRMVTQYLDQYYLPASTVTRD